jgi:outer membrane protein assembly factor BamD (BamD/ComL family)
VKPPAVHAVGVEVTAPEPVAAPSPSHPRAQRARQLLTPQESYAAELRLLQGAQSDYTSQDFPDALVLLAEHARRFPEGRLAEEREALRIRSLEGAGRSDEARHALSAFGRRFPRSALLPRLQQQLRPTD